MRTKIVTERSDVESDEKNDHILPRITSQRTPSHSTVQEHTKGSLIDEFEELM